MLHFLRVAMFYKNRSCTDDTKLLLAMDSHLIHLDSRETKTLKPLKCVMQDLGLKISALLNVKISN